MQPGVEVKELRFGCAGCGAPVEYEPGTTKMKCPFCGREQDIPVQQRPIVEHDIAELNPVPHSSAQGMAADTRFFKCDKCGAVSALTGGQMTSKCAFCDSPVVVETPPMAGMVSPESLVPFAIKKEQAAKMFKDWIGGLWFRPSDLQKRASMQKIDSFYVPHFTFDANASSQWSGYAGHYYYVTEYYNVTVNGRSERRSRQVQKIRWEYRSGSHSAFYDDVLINASKGMSSERLGKIYPFELAGLVPYAPDFLSGFGAEAYSVDPMDCWNNARGQMYDKEKSACAALLDGDTHRDLVVNSDFQNVKWKHLLLPVYISSYMYGDKVYSFMVNAQTGKCDGSAPYSWPKILGTVAIVIVAAVVGAKLAGLF